MKKTVLILIAVAVAGLAIFFLWPRNAAPKAQDATAETQDANPALTVVSIEPTIAPDAQAYKTLDMFKQEKPCLWVSEYGDKLCYYISGEGCYVCDVDGENDQFIARDLRAAKWLNDNVIVGMEDYDDGMVLISSAIVAYNIESKEKTVLTPDTMIATDPVVVDGNVVFTAGNEYYVIKLK